MDSEKKNMDESNKNDNTNEKKSSILNLKPILKNEKAVKAIIFAGLALIILIFLSDMFTGITSPSNLNLENDGNSTVAEHELELEKKLERAISAIDGVRPGALTIVVTLDSLSETIYAERGSSVTTVITPRVRGVAIVCEGAADIVVRQRIVELVSRLLGINSTSISVTY